MLLRFVAINKNFDCQRANSLKNKLLLLYWHIICKMHCFLLLLLTIHKFFFMLSLLYAHSSSFFNLINDP